MRVKARSLLRSRQRGSTATTMRRGQDGPVNCLTSVLLSLPVDFQGPGAVFRSSCFGVCSSAWALVYLVFIGSARKRAACCVMSPFSLATNAWSGFLCSSHAKMTVSQSVILAVLSVVGPSFFVGLSNGSKVVAQSLPLVRGNGLVDDGLHRLNMGQHP